MPSLIFFIEERKGRILILICKLERAQKGGWIVKSVSTDFGSD